MTLNQAAARGIRRVKLPSWTGEYLKIDILQDGGHGPWVRLYSPVQSAIGEPTPQLFLALGSVFDSDEWEEYSGPIEPDA